MTYTDLYGEKYRKPRHHAPGVGGWLNAKKNIFVKDCVKVAGKTMQNTVHLDVKS